MNEAAHADASLLHDAVPLLGFALVFVLIFRRFGLGATLGYLVAGALVGPHVLGLVGGAEGKMDIAELGIVLLLFLVGLELNPSRLWRMKQDIFAIGGLQVVACGLVIAAILFTVARFSPYAALALGLPLALSSTAQVLPMLQSAGRMGTPFGERAFAILLFQDLSIVPMITIVAAMSRNPADAGGPPGWLLFVYTVVAIVGLIAAGRYLLRPLFRLIGNLGEREMFVFAGLFTVIASAAVMEALGLSAALGAFIAGMMLADSPYRHELEADVEPFRSILLGLFFLAVGMMLDLGAIAERPVFVVTMALTLVVVKAAIVMGIALLFRTPWRPALALGLLLSQGGEFGFVLFAQAKDAWLIAPEAASLFGAIVTLSMATTPFLMMATRRFRAEPLKREERDGPQADGSNALIVGYGRFGQTVGQMLLGQGIPVTLIDTDIEMIDIAGEFGAKVYYGDGTRIDMLRQAGAADAELIMFCIDGDQIGPDLVAAVHEAFPKAAIFVRAFDRRALLKLKGTAVTGVVREVLDSAVRMARQAMAAVGVDAAEIDRTEDLYRRRDRERLKIQYEEGDMLTARARVLAETGGWVQRNPDAVASDAADVVPPRKATETGCG
ncbi:cation:proton antiporter domain-containing protein [Sphingomonas sp. RS2018]